MIGERIKALRLAHNISQVKLARDLNVSKQSVSNWENNNILPSIDIIKKLSIYFSCTSDYLLGLENDYRSTLEITDLTPEQAAHIQHIINDFQSLNERLSNKK